MKTYFGALIKRAEGNWLVTPDFVALLCIIRGSRTITAEDLEEGGWHRDIAERVLSVAYANPARK